MSQFCRRMTLILTIAFACLTLSSVSACGQKGPLFLPGDPSEISPEPPEQPEDEADEEESASAEPNTP